MNIRARLSLVGCIIVGILGAISWAAHIAWDNTRQLDRHFEQVGGESLRIADQFNLKLQALNSDLLHYRLGYQQEHMLRFNEAAESFPLWLQGQEELFRSSEELSLLERIAADFSAYVGSARLFMAQDAKGRSDREFTDAIQTLELQYGNLLVLGYDLANLHKEALHQEIMSSRETVKVVERIIYFSLASLVCLLLLFSLLVLREVIRPLRHTIIDHRKKLEKQEKIASLGLLAAGLAHEIRNPLTAMKARAYLLEKSGSLDTSNLENLAVIGGEIHRLEGIVQSFLDLSHPRDPECKVFCPDEIVVHVVKLMGLQWEQHGIELIADAHSNARINADADQLKQALINLIRNGAESIDDGGTVKVSTEVKIIRYEGETKERVCIHISDTGKGIPMEVQQSIFEPFYTTKSEGTGLGLALTRQMLHKQGADISYQTTIGKGSTFSILFEKVELD